MVCHYSGKNNFYLTKMTYSCCIFLICLTLCSKGYALPVERDVTPPPSSSYVCSTVYHGQCIDTYKFQCMGIAIPGVCGNATAQHFNSIDFGALTAIQCCNGWSINQVGTGTGGDSGSPIGR